MKIIWREEDNLCVGGAEVGRGKYLGSTIHRYDTAYLLDKLILREKNNYV
jgi:hypothetical protein